MHGLDDLGRRDRPCARETLQKRCKAEEMVTMSVGDIDRGEVLATRGDPIQQSLRLPDSEKGVHENGIALTGDERRGICHPHQLVLAGWQIATEARALYREYIPLKFIVRSVGCRHRQVLSRCETFAMPEFATANALWIATWATNGSPGFEQMLANHSVEAAAASGNWGSK